MVKDMMASVPIVRVNATVLPPSKGQGMYDYTVPLVWEGRYYRDSTLDMFKTTRSLSDSDWPYNLDKICIFRNAYNKEQGSLSFFVPDGEFIRHLAANNVSNVLQRLENLFVEMMVAHREYILNGIIYMVMCLKMNSPVQREASIHLIWCFLINMIFNGHIEQMMQRKDVKSSFANFKKLLKFNFVFPRAHEKFDLKGAIDNMDTFLKQIHSRFNCKKTYRSLSVPRCLLTLLHMCVYQNPDVMQGNSLVSGPGVNAFISLVSYSFNSNKMPIILSNDLISSFSELQESHHML